MNMRTRRILYGTGAAIVAAALAIGGTYAYTLFEHTTNSLLNSPEYLARLVEDHDFNPSWVVGQEIRKEVFVRNMGGTTQMPGDNWGDIYVRINLKEYMDVTPINYEYYPPEEEGFNTRFMTDKTGNFVRFDVEAGAGEKPSEDEMANIKASAVWEKVFDVEDQLAVFLEALSEDNFVKIDGYFDSTEYWYLVTKGGDPNGQYGSFVVTDRVADESKRFSITGGQRAAGVNYGTSVIPDDPEEHNSDECKYPSHRWGEDDASLCSLPSHAYVSWTLGDNILMADQWDETPVDAWILDPVSGWATWGNALEPGERTELLLKSITPLKMADGDMLYVIHADMQATDLTDMYDDSLWGGDEWILKRAFSYAQPVSVESVSVEPTDKAMFTGQTAQLTAEVSPDDATNKTLSWSSSEPGVATVNNLGEVKALTAGTTTITVTTADGGFTAECEVTVTVETHPATALSIVGGDRAIAVGDEYQLQYNVTPTYTTDMPAWESDDTDVVTVHPTSGKITGVAQGTANVTLTMGSLTATIEVTVDYNYLPLNGDGPFESRHRQPTDINNNNEYSFNARIYASDFDNCQLYEAGAIKLVDVLGSAFPNSQYSNVSVAPKTGQGLDPADFTVGVDKSQVDYAILYTYYGTAEDWLEAKRKCVEDGEEWVSPSFEVVLVLSADGYLDTEITVILTTDQSMYG